MNNDLIKQLNKMNRLTQSATMDDLSELVSLFTSLIKELKTHYDVSIKDTKGELSIDITNAIQEINNTEERLTRLVENFQSVSSSDTKRLYSQITEEIENAKSILPKYSDIPNMEKHTSEILLKCTNMISVIDAQIELLDTAVNFRDRLETLEGEERLDKSAIKGLEELENRLDTLEKMKFEKGKTVFVGGGQSGGRIVKSYDIFSQLNGVLKTFTLPAFYRVISVHSSSFPFSFRETVDYTTDASAMTITFTSEITAGSTLATGQTITIVYSEA